MKIIKINENPKNDPETQTGHLDQTANLSASPLPFFSLGAPMPPIKRGASLADECSRALSSELSTPPTKNASLVDALNLEQPEQPATDAESAASRAWIDVIFS